MVKQGDFGIGVMVLIEYEVYGELGRAGWDVFPDIGVLVSQYQAEFITPWEVGSPVQNHGTQVAISSFKLRKN